MAKSGNKEVIIETLRHAEYYDMQAEYDKTQMEKLNKLRITAGYTAIELPLKL